MDVTTINPVYTLGEVAHIEAVLDADPTTTQWLVRGPDGIENDLTASVVHDGSGQYHLDVLIDQLGDYHWRIVTQGPNTAGTGVFTGVNDYAVITDPLDLHVMVPRARRRVEGPFGPPPGRPALTDDQLYPMVADACADIILYSASLFGHQLIVTARDPTGGYPIAWATDTALDEWEVSVIVTQLALDYWRLVLPTMKTSEHILNEGTEWDYTLSANVLRDYLATLQADRDAALMGLMRWHPTLERYASNIRVRDQVTVTLLEWWSTNIADRVPGLPGGQEAAVVPWTPGWSGQWGNP